MKAAVPACLFYMILTTAELTTEPGAALTGLISSGTQAQQLCSCCIAQTEHMEINALIDFVYYCRASLLHCCSFSYDYMLPIVLTFVFNLQDGGLLLNNPSALAVHECKCLWPDVPLQCLVSLGTGRYESDGKTSVTYTSLKAKLTNVISSATDTEGWCLQIHLYCDSSKVFMFLIVPIQRAICSLLSFPFSSLPAPSKLLEMCFCVIHV